VRVAASRVLRARGAIVMHLLAHASCVAALSSARATAHHAAFAAVARNG
jgi:hypothetical protein